jgi:hypothetical protein
VSGSLPKRGGEGLARFLLSPTIHKFGAEFIHSGLSAVRQAQRPELFEGLSEYGKAFN